MSKKVCANIKCPHCNHKFDMELYCSIWGEYPENKELVLSNKINVAYCPKCHKETKLEFSLLYTNTPKAIAVWWEPKPDPRVEQDVQGYQRILPDSHLAKAPRIRDWEDFKNKIIELEENSEKRSPSHKISMGLFKECLTDIKLTLTSLIFLVLSLFDYKKCRYYDDFCFNFPYGFYTILKFVICGYFAYNAYIVYKNAKISFNFIISCLFAIIYNPFVKIAFGKEEWYVINIFTIIIIVFLARTEFITIYERYKNKKKLEEYQTFLKVEQIVRNEINNPLIIQIMNELKAKDEEQYKRYVYAKLLQISQNKKETTTQEILEDN